MPRGGRCSWRHVNPSAAMSAARVLSCRRAVGGRGRSAGARMSATRAFLEARDQLLRCREDLGAALRGFRWPAFAEFNWARDYFDVIAAGNDAPALRVVDDAGGDET